jgi:hypothetical protein
MFWQNKKQIDVDSVIKVFDELTRYHAKNTIAYKGWKTNKASKLNYKAIIPYCKSSYMNFVDYHAEKKLADIDKICCIVTGKNFSEITQTADVIKGFGTEEQFESTFFKIRAFGVGTVHLVFKDRAVCDLINQVVAIERKWIGSDY